MAEPLLSLKVLEPLPAGKHVGKSTIKRPLDLHGHDDLGLGQLALLGGVAATAPLLKGVSTHWGPPTFQIDSIKTLPTQRLLP